MLEKSKNKYRNYFCFMDGCVKVKATFSHRLFTGFGYITVMFAESNCLSGKQ